MRAQQVAIHNPLRRGSVELSGQRIVRVWACEGEPGGGSPRVHVIICSTDPREPCILRIVDGEGRVGPRRRTYHRCISRGANAREHLVGHARVIREALD